MRIMRIFLASIWGLALASLALGVEEGKEKTKGQPKRNAAPSSQISQPAGTAGGKPTGVQALHPNKSTHQVGTPTGAGTPTNVGKRRPFNPANKPQAEPRPTIIPHKSYFNPANKPQTETSRQPLNRANKQSGTESPPTEMSTVIPRNTNSQPTTEIAPAEQFHQNRRIQGSDRWIGSDYEVFRNYRSEWHDRDWWRSHHSRIVFGVGGWYYWNAGYWFPAWGYDPGAHYAYDGPMYTYNDLSPDQVIANVQGALQQQGYYRGEVDSQLDSPMRAAIADYQRDHGLQTTSAIDRPTLRSLGMK
jgi:hypothetical protein